MQRNKRAEGNNYCWNIAGDARGYYAWLPATLIYQDLSFKYTDSIELRTPDCSPIAGMPVQDYRNSFDGRFCDKYYPGTAVLMLPFFTVAHLYTKYCTTLPANGYSIYYFKIMALAGIFYFAVSMLLLLGIFKKLQLNTLQQLGGIVLITLGSNIVYYTVDAPTYSHIYCAALMSAIVYLCLHIAQDIPSRLNSRYIALLSLIMGLLIITRPVNIILLTFVPLFFLSHRHYVVKYFSNKPLRIASLLPGLLWPVLMMCLHHAATGYWLLYSYKNERFNFLHPHLWQYLAHYNNSILLYTPLVLLPLLLWFLWYKATHKSLLLAVAIPIAIFIYVNSSWWSWSFGLSFGSRAMLDAIPLWAIPLALSIKETSRGRRALLVSTYAICCVLTMVLYDAKSAGGYMSHPDGIVTDYWPALLHLFR